MNEYLDDSEDQYELLPERSLRVNTVRVDLSRLGFTPCAYQLQEFLVQYLEVQPGDVRRLQWSRKERCLFVKMRSLGAAQYLVGAHSGRHRFPRGNVRQRVVLSLEDGSTDVIVHDLSELIDEEQVQAFFSQFGTVQNVLPSYHTFDMRFAGVENGQLIVRMVVRRPIPRIVTVGGEETLVTYEGQPEPSSSLLAGLAHVAQSCFGAIRRCFCARNAS